MDKVVIKNLFEAPDLIPLVADWIYNEFWLDKAGYNPKVFEDKLRKATSSEKIPLSLIAFLGSSPVGTINLVENDDETRTHLTPWLAALIVLPPFRKQGVGSLLVRTLLEHAKRLKIEKLYLGTDSPQFYTKLGAIKYERARADLFIMCFHL